MPISKSDLKRVFRAAQSRSESDQTYYGKLGKLTDDGAAITLTDGLDDPNLVWVTLNGVDSQVVAALCTRVARKPRSNVILKLNTYRRLEVVDVDTTTNAADFGELASSLTIPPLAGEAVDARWVENNLAPRVYPAQAGGLLVTMESFDYDGGSWAEDDVDLTAYRPSTASKKAWIVVGVNSLTGNAAAVTGTERALTDDLSHADLVADADTASDGFIPVWGFVLENGQTSLTGATQNEPVRYRLVPKGGTSSAHPDAARLFKQTFTQANDGVNALFTPPANATILEVALEVTTAASAGSPTAKVGVSGADDRYMTTGENDLKRAAIFRTLPHYDEDTTPDALILTIAAASQTFTFTVYVRYGVAP